MLKKTGLWLLSVALALLIVIGLATGFMAWRLAQGPLPLQFMNGMIKSALIFSADGARSADIEDVVLSWDRAAGHLYMAASHVVLKDDQDNVIVSVDKMNAGFSASALFIGRLTFRSLEMINPFVTVHISKEGGVGLTLDSARRHFSGDVSKDPKWTDAAQKGSSLSFRFFRYLKMNDARILVLDEKTGSSLTFSAPLVEFQRSRRGYTAQLDAQMLRQIEDTPDRDTTILKGGAQYNKEAQETAGNLLFQNIRLDDLAIVLAPFTRQMGFDFTTLQKFEVPLNGEITASFNMKDQLERASLQFRGSGGMASFPEYYQTPLNVQNLLLSADYVGKTQTATLHDFYFEVLDNDHIIPFSVAGHWNATQEIDFRISLDDMPINRLKTYWPPNVAPGAYDWITENMTAGIIPKAWISVEGRVENQNLIAEKTEGLLDVADATIHYFEDFPLLTHVKGSASFNDKSVTITVLSGESKDMKIGESDIIITGLDQEFQDIDINTTLRGPLKTALQILDTPPYRFTHEMGLDPDTAGGNVAARLRFGFPLLKALPKEDVKFSASANMTDIYLKNVVAKQDVNNGQADLALDGDGLSIKGNARFANAPTDFTLTEDFSAVPTKQDLVFHMTLDEAARRSLDLPGQTWFKGNMVADGHFSSSARPDGTLDLSIDLTPTTLTFHDLNYTKRSGDAAKAKITVLLHDNVITSLRDISVQGPNMNVSGQAELAPDQFLPRQLGLNLSPLGNSNAQLQIQSQDNGNRLVSLKGARFDAAGLLESEPSAEPASKRKSRLEGYATTIQLALQEVLFSNNERFQQVSGIMRHNGTMWQTIDLSARLLPSGSLQVNWQPDNKGQALNISSDNAGAVLKALDLTDYVKGGNLSITGRGSGKLQPWIVEGRINVRDFQVVNAPVLARLLSLTSPGGLIDMLSGQGISFSRLRTNFKFGEDEIVLDDGRTSGPSIGLTFGGKIQRTQETVDLDGTIVPLYAINSALGSIPIIGDILVGAKGEGVFSATYSISGPSDNPQVSVNPLSAFTPGFLRRLLFQSDNE